MMMSDRDTLLFTGDSITDRGRARPVGENDGLGDGYVAMANAWLQCLRPDVCVRVLNTGVSGNRVIDLRDRWKSDVLDLAPDWLSMMIGVNDVWRHFGQPLLPRQVDLDEFSAVYRELLESVRPSLKGLFLLTPFYLETHPADPMRSRLETYANAVRALAGDFDAVLVDTQAAFDAVLKHRPTQYLSGDRVHPNFAGHAVIANAFLAAAGAM